MLAVSTHTKSYNSRFQDVVALIETDKVTVDIKATQAGVITQQFGAM